MNTLDIVLILLVVFSALIAAKRGLLRSLLNLGAVVGAGILSRMLAQPVAGLCYDQFLHNKIQQELLEILPEGSVSGQVSAGIDSILAELPQPVVAIAKQFGLYPQLNEGTQVLTVEAIEQDYIVPVVTGVMAVIATVILFIVIGAVLKIIVGMIDKRATNKDSHKWVHGFNALLGGVVGLVKGVIPAAVFCAAANVLAPVIGNANFSELVDNSYFCQFIASFFNN